MRNKWLDDVFLPSIYKKAEPNGRKCWVTAKQTAIMADSFECHCERLSEEYYFFHGKRYSRWYTYNWRGREIILETSSKNGCGNVSFGYTAEENAENLRIANGENARAEACECGFHACEYPLDCLKYYNPNNSVYHEVEQSGEISRHEDDTKVASTKIKIGAKLEISGLVKAAIEYNLSKVNPEAKSSEDCGASSATGNRGASESGNQSAIAVAWGYKAKAKGVLESYLVLADWREKGVNARSWVKEDWEFAGAKMIRIDGENYKEGVWYSMRNGKIVEVGEEE